MKRTGLLIAIVLTLSLVAWGSAGPAAIAVTAPGQAMAAANGCPLYVSCMDFIGVGCSCTGFTCNGKFICGTPVHIPPLR